MRKVFFLKNDYNIENNIRLQIIDLNSINNHDDIIGQKC